MKNKYKNDDITIVKTNHSDKISGTGFKCFIEIDGESHELKNLLYFYDECEITSFLNHWGGPANA